MSLKSGRQGIQSSLLNSSGIPSKGIFRLLKKAIQNIKVDGTSLPKTDGTVEIPLSMYNKITGECTFGLVKGKEQYGVYPDSNLDGYMVLYPATENAIDKRAPGTVGRAPYLPITCKNLDYAVKSALSNTPSYAYTDTERLAVLSKLGCSVDPDTGAVTWSAQESATIKKKGK